MSSRSDWSNSAAFPARHRKAIERELAAGIDQQRALEQRGVKDRNPPAGKKRARPEQALQIAIVTLADQWPMSSLLTVPLKWPSEIRYAKVGDYLIHVPNGGGRSKAEGGIFKAMGVRPGVADLFFMLPVCHRVGPCVAGIWFELKAGLGQLTEAQAQFAHKTTQAGYLTTRVRSVDEWQECTRDYLRGAVPLSLHLRPGER